MSTHRPILSTNEIYHVFNRSIGKESIFLSENHFNKILQIVDYYQYPQRIKLSKLKSLSETQQKYYLESISKNSPLVEIYAYTFMPNHFHFLLKQLQNRGISTFMSNIQNSFAKYYNLKNERTGGLFQNNFKSIRITNNEEFIHVWRYIHLNHVTSKIIEFDQLLRYERTSLPCYLNNKINKFVSTDLITNHFKTADRYLNFLKNQVDYQKKLKVIKDLLLD